MGMFVREDTYPEPLAFEVGEPVPFLAAFIPQCCHRVPVCCLVNSEGAFSQGIESDSNRRPSAREACTLTTMPPRPNFAYMALKTNFYYLLYIDISPLSSCLLKISRWDDHTFPLRLCICLCAYPDTVCYLE